VLNALVSAALGFLALAIGLIARWHYLRRKRHKMEADVNEARKTLDEIRALVEQPGWTRIRKILEVQAEGRRNEVLLQPTTDPYEQEYKKGEIQGIQLALQFPNQLIEISKAVLEAAKRLEEEGS
jgi:hypothetical protein